MYIVIEVHGCGEIEREHADRGLFDGQRQDRARSKAAVGGLRGGVPVAIGGIGERRDEHRLPCPDRVRFAQTGIDREGVAQIGRLLVLVAVNPFEPCAVVREQGDEAGGGTERYLAVMDDGPRDRFDRDRFRQRGAQFVQPVGARGERAVLGLAFAQGGFGLLALAELHVDAGPEGLGVAARMFGRFVGLGAHERFGGPASRIEQRVALLRGEVPRLVKAGDQHGDRPSGRHQRDRDRHGVGSEKVEDRHAIGGPGGRGRVECGNRLTAGDILERRVRRQRKRGAWQWRVTAGRADDFAGARALVDDHDRAGRRGQHVQELRQAGFDDGSRRSCTPDRGHQFLDVVSECGLTFGLQTRRLVGSGPSPQAQHHDHDAHERQCDQQRRHIRVRQPDPKNHRGQEGSRTGL